MTTSTQFTTFYNQRCMPTHLDLLAVRHPELAAYIGVALGGNSPQESKIGRAPKTEGWKALFHKTRFITFCHK